MYDRKWTVIDSQEAIANFHRPPRNLYLWATKRLIGELILTEGSCRNVSITGCHTLRIQQISTTKIIRTLCNTHCFVHTVESTWKMYTYKLIRKTLSYCSFAHRAWVVWLSPRFAFLHQKWTLPWTAGVILHCNFSPAKEHARLSSAKHYAVHLEWLSRLVQGSCQVPVVSHEMT